MKQFSILLISINSSFLLIHKNLQSGHFFWRDFFIAIIIIIIVSLHSFIVSIATSENNKHACTWQFNGDDDEDDDDDED